MIPWTEEPGGLQPMGSQRVTTERLSVHTRTLEQVLSNKSKAPGGGSSLGHQAHVQEDLREFSFTCCLLEAPV